MRCRIASHLWLPRSSQERGLGGEVGFKIKKECAMDDDDDTGDANPGEDA